MEKVINYKLKSILAEFGLSNKELAKVINRSLSSVNKKMENQTFTQNEMILIVKYFENLDREIDMNIFM